MTSPEPDVRGLLARVQALESQNRRWKLAGLLLLTLVASASLIGFKSADRIEPPVIRAQTVEAQGFALKDADGTVRARLKMSGDNPTLEFLDRDGKVIWSAPTKAKLLPAR